MNVGERFGWDTVPFVLVAWRLILAVSAVWLNRVTFQNTNTLLPFLAANVVGGLDEADALFVVLLPDPAMELRAEPVEVAGFCAFFTFADGVGVLAT